jgi:hypothetical protein
LKSCALHRKSSDGLARGRTSVLRNTVALFKKESSTKVSVQRPDPAIAGPAIAL